MEESNYMFKKNGTKFKKGAASFYIVAFATLILVIVVTSFAAVIVSEVTRTSNDDLAQSAYDSALAGVEDAKLAYYNYQACKEQGNSASEPGENDTGTASCQNIIWYVEKSNDCDMVAKILGKVDRGTKKHSGDTGGVLIKEEKEGGKTMQQAYTCNKISMGSPDYRSTLTEASPTKLIPIQVSGDTAKAVKTMKVSWYSYKSVVNGGSLNYRYIAAGGKLAFPSSDFNSGSAPVPPMISVQLIQTNESGFNLSDFDKTTGDEKTNRATMYLVPTNDLANAGEDVPDSRIGTCRNVATYPYTVCGEENPGSEEPKIANLISMSQVVKTNDRSVKNLPFAVYCDPDGSGGGEFVCSVEIELPNPVGYNSERNDDTFMIAVSLPYGQPSTDFALSFYCDVNVGNCSKYETELGRDSNGDPQIMLSGMQAVIDSTGRANNLYRRVEARIDSFGSFPYPLYGIELLGEDSSSGSLLDKNLIVTSEHSNGSYGTALDTSGNWGNGNYNK